MCRKHCKRRVTRVRLPAGLRPKLSREQVRDLALVHTVNLDAIARGEAEPSMLWDVLECALTWLRAAQDAGVGAPEMQRQVDMATRLAERFARTGLVRFDGPDYQLAKEGVGVMDTLASTVDRDTIVAACQWSRHQVKVIAAEVTRLKATLGEASA